MWIVCVPADSPWTSSRNGTTSPSAYAELLPFRSPFCHEQFAVRGLFAHWSRLTPTDPPEASDGRIALVGDPPSSHATNVAAHARAHAAEVSQRRAGREGAVSDRRREPLDRGRCP